MSKFQTILLAVSVLAIITGVVFFAAVSNSGKTNQVPLVMWGSLPQDTMTTFLGTFPRANGVADFNITYVQKDSSVFYQQLTEAVANGTAPDIVYLTQDQLLKNKNRLAEIPYSVYPARDFKNNFVQEGALFQTSTGILALPLTIDPLVMYWNRSIFSTAGIAVPPSYWDELLTLAPRLTQKDSALNIQKSLIALGEYRNIPHAKDILATLMMQAGTPIVAKQTGGANNTPTGGYKSVINEKFDFVLVPGQAALDFYTQFSNPTKSVYSWNRALPSALDQFAAGDAALYIGYASELPLIQKKNPNLNFDVAPLLQSRSAEANQNQGALVFGRVGALGVVRTSANQAAAIAMVERLTQADVVSAISQTFSVAPVLTSVLANPPLSDAYAKVFYNAALQAKGWLDPDALATETLFKDMIEAVVAGRQSSVDALRDAHVTLYQLLDSVGASAVQAQ